MIQQPSPAPTIDVEALAAPDKSKRNFKLAWLFLILSLLFFFIPFLGLATAIPGFIFSLKAKKQQEERGYVIGSMITVTFSGFLVFLGLMVLILGIIFLPSFVYSFQNLING